MFPFVNGLIIQGYLLKLVLNEQSKAYKTGGGCGGGLF